MTITSFQLVNNQTFLPANVSNGKVFTSADQFNGTGIDLSTSMRIVIDYHDLQVTSSGPTFQAIVESKSPQGQYSILAYQFEEFTLIGTQQKRQIIMAPILTVQTIGVDDPITIGGSIVEQVSNQQGILSGIWRVSINITDPSSRFVSIRMSIYGERFNQLTFPADFNNVLTDKDGNFITTETI